jgi:ferric-dicitrate binding protein FerR (iron transport regulator)
MNTDDSDTPLSDDERMCVLLDRYLAGDAQSSDVAIVREWVAADPRRAEIVEDLRRIREVAGVSRRHRSASEAWGMLLPRLEVETPGIAAGSVFGSHRGERAPNDGRVADNARASAGRSRVWYAGVAALLLVASLPLVISSRSALNRSSTLPRPSPDALATFATVRGRRAEVRLPDGTRVSLAPESRVTWSSSGVGLARDVLLEGEAYFDVVHDDRRPFRVRALNVVIRDVGTRFAVRAYPTDSLVRVAVTQGQVRLRATNAPPGSGTILDPGMLGVVDAVGVTSLREDADTARYNAFARGQMQFVRAPLRAVIADLERWYDIDIRLSDSALGNRRITATLDDQTLPDLLTQLSITLSLRVTRTGRLVVLHAD